MNRINRPHGIGVPHMSRSSQAAAAQQQHRARYAALISPHVESWDWWAANGLQLAIQELDRIYFDVEKVEEGSDALPAQV